MRRLEVPLHAVPRNHKEIDGHISLISNGGIEGKLIVNKKVGDTSNDDARFMMRKRVEVYADHLRKGGELGRDLNVRIDAKDKDQITLRIYDGGKYAPVTIEPQNDGTYVAMKRRFGDLREATARIMQQYEMQYGSIVAQQEVAVAAGYGMRR